MEQTQINKNNQRDIVKQDNAVRQRRATKVLVSNNNGLIINNKNEKLKDINIILFYKFQKIENPKYFARKNKGFCKKIGVLGKILLAKEGINGSISGTKEQTENYKKFLFSEKGFEDVKFKEELAFSHPFTKMHVRIRKEIVSLKKKIHMKNKGKYLTPKEFLELYENNEVINNKINNKGNQSIIEAKNPQVNNNLQANKHKASNNNLNINNLIKNNSVIILDARNYYEYKLGRFKNAINPNIKTFREFPKFVEEFKKNFKGDNEKNKHGNKKIKQKIVMYCTGGIRCEKASAYMKEQGFENVYQLDGGIINFCQQLPNTIWEGKCFVFDKRLMSDLNQNNKPITRCVNCNELCDLYRNCKNLECDDLVIQCVKCQEKLQGCCSEKCLKDFLNYARKRAFLKKSGEWKPKEVLQNYVK